MLVLFDSCWDPLPKLGKQLEPRPGIHNSRWVQSPGAIALQDIKQYPRLEAYVKGVVSAFANDNRILAWDIWNEPDNTNDGSYGDSEAPNKLALVEALLPKAFEWARSASPSQPLTSGLSGFLWWNKGDPLPPIPQIQLENSDILTFHFYADASLAEIPIQVLAEYHRPMICTEYLYRPLNNTFQSILPVFKQYHVGAINWGLIAGKTQTYYPWDSWDHPYIDHEPETWAHEVFRKDGTPYNESEVALIRQMTEQK